MAYGTLPNIANAEHEPTPDTRAEQIAHNLLKLPRSHFTIVDGTCGEGNLLAPFQDNAHAELIGIEINGKWAEQAATLVDYLESSHASLRVAQLRCLVGRWRAGAVYRWNATQAVASADLCRTPV